MKKEVDKVDDDEEEISTPFRSFSMLEQEEKKNPLRRKEKKSQSTEETTDQNAILVEPIEDRVRENLRFICSSLIHQHLFRLNHQALCSIQRISVDIVIKTFHPQIFNYMKSTVSV